MYERNSYKKAKGDWFKKNKKEIKQSIFFGDLKSNLTKEQEEKIAGQMKMDLLKTKEKKKEK